MRHVSSSNPTAIAYLFASFTCLGLNFWRSEGAVGEGQWPKDEAIEKDMAFRSYHQPQISFAFDVTLISKMKLMARCNAHTKDAAAAPELERFLICSEPCVGDRESSY